MSVLNFPKVAPPLIEARGVVVSREGRLLLDHVDLGVGAGEIVTLIGPNGAGKSSLVRVLLGLLKPDTGTVNRAAGLRIGYAPQRLHIEPTLPIDVRRFLTLGETAAEAELMAILGRVGAGSVLDRQMGALSGGERQRVVLARALLRRPDLLVLDEPMSGVDLNGQAELYALIGRVRDETGAGILLVSHDLHLVMARTDRVICLERHVCCAGRPIEVTRSPEFVRLFGHRFGEAVALYRHEHDHVHGPGGAVMHVHSDDH
ncbi:MAG: metal ABC transporter ATP-binding protein [Geminicoccaceae bacterium]